MRLTLLALLTACSPDFGLQGIEPYEEGAEDTGEWQDEPEADEPDDEPEDEPDLPEDEEQPEDEPDEPDEPEDEEPPPEDDCEHTSDLVYVIERDDDTLYLFDPDALAFERLGRVSCPGSAAPESMAVSRDGTAYVRGSDDEVYAVDLETLACERTDIAVPASLGSFGMGFATEDADTWRDDLYVADADSVGLLDTRSGSLEILGGMPSQSELTGNAEGELWAILPLESPAALALLDKDTGRELDRIAMSGFPNPGDIDTFAFATWGGDFWVFVRSYGMGNTTDVYRVTPDGTMTRELRDVGFDVVGAGVSTCAPSE